MNKNTTWMVSGVLGVAGVVAAVLAAHPGETSPAPGDVIVVSPGSEASEPGLTTGDGAGRPGEDGTGGQDDQSTEEPGPSATPSGDSGSSSGSGSGTGGEASGSSSSGSGSGSGTGGSEGERDDDDDDDDDAPETVSIASPVSAPSAPSPEDD
ncbi:hypothetical protein [Ruania albidiflava]|nr:hypothetical protein [Ruania albidiflava]